MAVFTKLTLENAKILCQKYDLNIRNITAIEAGITNSNYFIKTTDNTQYVLTIIEQISLERFPDICNMLVNLPQAMPHPRILSTMSNSFFETYEGKPVIICEFIKGQSPQQPSHTQIIAVAKAMAHLHNSKQPDFRRSNPRGIAWMQNTALKVLPQLQPNEQLLLQATLSEIQNFDFDILPHGIIHCDLFRDNTLFIDNELMAIIDFYYACYDSLLFDIAISVNDWCFEQPELFLEAYQSIRPLTDSEVNGFTTMRRITCLRFWLSRLYDLHFPVVNAQTLVKDPNEMWDKLTRLHQL